MCWDYGALRHCAYRKNKAPPKRGLCGELESLLLHGGHGGSLLTCGSLLAGSELLLDHGLLLGRRGLLGGRGRCCLGGLLFRGWLGHLGGTWQLEVLAQLAVLLHLPAVPGNVLRVDRRVGRQLQHVLDDLLRAVLALLDQLAHVVANLRRLFS